MKEKKTKIKKDLFREIRSIRSDSKNTGITLIALVITIVVLLVLAGVVVNLSMGENGIIQKAQTAVDKYKQAAENEQIELAKYEDIIDNARETVTIPKEEYEILLNQSTYSQEEKKIGTWDGEDLYRKLYKITSQQTENYAIANVATYNIKRCYGWQKCKSSGGTWYQPIEGYNNTTFVGWKESNAYPTSLYGYANSNSIYILESEIIIEYTKNE